MHQAFNDLKHALTTAPVLVLPDPGKPFELVCDASGFGIGAVLLQNYSRKMTAAERNYVVTEQELLATVEALRVFRCYLLSDPFFADEDNTAGMSLIEGLWWKEGRIVMPNSADTKAC